MVIFHSGNEMSYGLGVVPEGDRGKGKTGIAGPYKAKNYFTHKYLPQ